MHIFLGVAGAGVFGLLGVVGVVSIVTGWVAPWGRTRVLRPRLWGAGCVVAAVSGGLFFFLGPYPGHYGPLPWLCWSVFFGALIFQTLAQRPGRAGPATTKKNAS
ncbi:hypothetical protein [Streptomyces beihaiensis]|uniref:Integral membrane protein n=1 Tax=Streptomyces beihaiensis TaxID=2984495 RepID=A0ABT3TVF0_9ACTN|nr:hypothetical protein [Streptomyces beihaiensis]MCX3061028.1 hypothetical protein [Streptomyces beihaiensis]